MQRLLMLVVLSGGWITGCTGSETPSSSPPVSAAEWTKIGETETYTYYADHGSIRKADETVTMSDLFDYKVVQTEGGSPALSKITVREYDCQNRKSQPVKTTWYADHMGSGAVGRSAGPAGKLTTSVSGTST
ncbi:MAG: hypothetical protein K2Q17_18145, partial [Nitrospiraceae bacterium]|nr:hypothetical protein [Nitrospiraceae bacterium]